MASALAASWAWVDRAAADTVVGVAVGTEVLATPVELEDVRVEAGERVEAATAVATRGAQVEGGCRGSSRRSCSPERWTRHSRGSVSQ